MKTSHKKVKISSSIDNKNEYQLAMEKLNAKIPNYGDFFATDISERTKQWNRMDKLWDPLCEKYAWACPDNRALNVLCHFSPLVEIGSGKGYWASLLEKRGADIICYDKYGTDQQGDFWTVVQQGGPEVLLEPSIASRNLFLCFPDEEESIAIVSLEKFKGEYVIHVGELLAGNGTCGSVPQAPWGRTSSAEFQIALASSFHCLYVAKLEARLPFARDCITVWRRTKFVVGREFPDAEKMVRKSQMSKSSGNSDDDEEEEDEDEDDDYDDADESGSYSAFNRQYFGNLFEQEKMLADRSRMDFYYKAIQRYVKPGAVAIDLGTGTGILAAFADKKGASKVYAIDHSKAALKIAQKVGIANQLKNVQYIQGHSSKFHLASDAKVDIILHEQMGDCLFDEDMVRNVCDVRDRLLKPGGLILPSCFDLFIEPVKLDDARHVPFIWDLKVHGIDFSCMKEDKRQDDEYYHLRSCDPGLVDYFLSTPEPVYSMDLHTLVEGEIPLSLTFSKTVVRSGQFDGFVVYFRARAGKDLSLSTGPHDENRAPHWGFRILRDTCDQFQIGDIIDVTVNVGQWPDLNSWRWEHTKREKRVGKEMKDKSKKKSSSSSSEAVSFMSMSDLAKLRGEPIDVGANNDTKKQKKNKSDAESASSYGEAVSFMSISDLAKLRNDTSSEKKTSKKRKSDFDEDEDEDEDEGEGEDEDEEDEDRYNNLTALQKRREVDLDRQYEETNEKKWANVNPTELLPDRAIDSLKFLLE